MKYIGKLLGSILLIANIVVIVGLLCSGYSSYIDPVVHPIWACAGLTFGIFLLLNVLFLLFWLVVYPKFALCAVVGLLLCWGPIRVYCPIHLGSAQAGNKSIKVLSYNTRWFGCIPLEKNNIISYLKESDADIICLQEMDFWAELTHKEADKFLSTYKYKHFNAKIHMGCYSRFPILSAKPVKYESESNGSMAYEMLVHGDTVLVINNHLESYKLTGDDKAVYKQMVVHPNKHVVKKGSEQLIKKLADAAAIRAPQAQAIQKYIKNQKHEKVIVCGDFNDSPMSYALRLLREDLQDAFATAGNGLGLSYHLNGFYFRIDHILVSSHFKVTQCKVDNSIDDSDHYPIYCQIQLK